MKVKVGVIQDSPIFFDKKATLEKVRKLVEVNAGKGCHLLVFPESFIPGYPRGFDFGARVGSRTLEGKELYARYHSQSIDLNSEDLQQLEALSKKHGVYLIMGVTEKNRSNGSLYCSMLYISPKSGLLGVHRKIKPTGTERLIWAEAGGESLVTFDTEIGRLGGLICWENYMPLARMAMYRKGVEIYVAPTADSREDWTTTMKHIALEGRCFVLGCNQYYRKEYYPPEFQPYIVDTHEGFCEGGSIIVSPLGAVLAGPLFGKEGVLIADLDLEDVARSKLDFDVNGHYSRPDIFHFNVPDQPDIQEE
jgi:nitrilase